jgi:N-acetylated-alpha-linked acidic dipeptidase
LHRTVPNVANAIGFSREYTAKPHLAGSKTDYDTAVDFLETIQKHLGIAPPDQTPVYSAGTPESRSATLNIPFAEKPFAWIDKYFPVLDTPLDRHLEILDNDGSVAWEANLEEVADRTDEDAHEYFDAVPAWHGLSKDGNVSGQLVYAGYGTKHEYDDLVAAGMDFTGKIVLTRYGRNFRGLKVGFPVFITRMPAN